MVSSMESIPLLDQENQNEVQHDIFGHGMLLASHDAHDINGILHLLGQHNQNEVQYDFQSCGAVGTGISVP